MWVARGSKKQPRQIVGLVNFRPISKDVKNDYDRLRDWHLGCAEAFLCLPEGWTAEDVPLVDGHYIRTLTPAMCPDVPGKALFRRGQVRPRIETVPFAAQWSVSGTCAQTSAYMAALQLCRPGMQCVRVEGPLTIACVAEDVGARLGRGHLRSRHDPHEDNIERHREHFVGRGHCGEPPQNLFDITQGASLHTLSETMRLIAGPGSQGSGLSPAYITSRYEREADRLLSLCEFRRTIESALSSGYPILAQVDSQLARAASIAMDDGCEESDREDCRSLLANAEAVLSSGGENLPAPPRDCLSDLDRRYDPLQQVHCVVVIGGKRLLSKDDGIVLFHDPWHGPYRQARVEDFYIAASLPYMGFVRKNNGPYPASDNGAPALDMLVPIPYGIGFDLVEIVQHDVIRHDAVEDESQRVLLQAVALNPANADEWRVRLMSKEAVWDCYFEGAGNEQRNDVALTELMPHGISGSDQVLCVEVFASPDDALNLRPRTVLFAHLPPAPPETAESASDRRERPSPTITGGFGVDRSEEQAQVVFFRIQQDGVPVPLSHLFLFEDVIAIQSAGRRRRG